MGVKVDATLICNELDDIAKQYLLIKASLEEKIIDLEAI